MNQVLVNRDPLEAVRAATRESHAFLDQHLEFAGTGASVDSYAEYVRAMYGWLAPLEEELWVGDWCLRLERKVRSAKARWIEEDFRALGIDLSTVTMKPINIELGSPAARFGVAYVIEGSQLGGQVLKKRLAPVLPDDVGCYLSGYGVETGRMWQKFLTEFRVDVSSADDIEEASQAALATFEDITRWFDQCGVLK